MTEQRVRILEAVRQYGVLSRDQIQRLTGYASVNTVNHALRALYHNGLLERRYVPTVVAAPDGDHQALYLLDRKGAEFLASLHGLADWRELGWKRRDNAISWWQLYHRRDTNEIVIRLSAGGKAAGCQMEWLPERALRRPERQSRVTIQIADDRTGTTQKTMTVVADAFVLFTTSSRKRTAFFIECDRGTSSVSKSWRTKVLAYDVLLQSEAYARAFPLPPHTVGILTVTTGGGKRLANLKRVTEQVSQSQHYLFSTMQEIVHSDPVREPVWQSTHGRRRHPLIQT